MTQKSEVRFRKIGLSFESELLNRLDSSAERKFKGNRSAVANYLSSALEKKISLATFVCTLCEMGSAP